jgi:cell division protein FtsZ
MCDAESIPCIKVVGVGGAGENTINRLYNSGGIEGAELIALDFDKRHLDVIKADRKVQLKLPPIRGFVCNSFPGLGEKAADMAKDTIGEAVRGADMVLMVVGMGGSMGTGAAPIVARVAKGQGAFVMCIAATPFKVERARMVKAEAGVAMLKKEADAVIVLDNNKLLQYVPNLPLEQSFSVMDQLMAETVKNITEAIILSSAMNIDLDDLKAIVGSGNTAVMMFGETASEKGGDIVDR